MTPIKRQTPLQIVNVSLAGSERDYDEDVTFLEQPFHLRRVGTSGDVEAAKRLVRSLAADADVLAVTGIREAKVAGLYTGRLHAIEEVKAATRLVPVTDGHALRDVLQEWAVRQVHGQMPGYWANARVVVLGGSNHARVVRSLRDHTENFEFADPLLRLDLHNRVDRNAVLNAAVTVGGWPVRRLPSAVRDQLRAPGRGVSTSMARRALPDSHVVVGTYDELHAFDLGDLHGKTVISSSISD